jgi:hypothetical protein
VFFVGRSEQPPVGGIDVADFRIFRRRSNDRHVRAQRVSVADVRRSLLHAGYAIRQFHAIAQRLQVIHLQWRTLSRLVPLIEIGGNADAVDHERIGAQVRHLVGHVEVQPIQH